jgi:hypothetical protein
VLITWQVLNWSSEMAELINHNSAILFGMLILAIGVIVLVRRGFETRRVAAFAVLVVLVAAGFFMIRPEAGTDASADEITAQIGAGMPVLLEFQSQN